MRENLNPTIYPLSHLPIRTNVGVERLNGVKDQSSRLEKMDLKMVIVEIVVVAKVKKVVEVMTITKKAKRMEIIETFRKIWI